MKVNLTEMTQVLWDRSANYLNTHLIEIVFLKKDPCILGRYSVMQENTRHTCGLVLVIQKTTLALSDYGSFLRGDRTDL